MKPEKDSERLLAITRAKSKMYEYGIPTQHHIEIPTDPARLFVLAIGLLGDLAARVCAAETNSPEIAEDQQTLRFAAYFFDAYDSARLNNKLKSYLTVIGAAAYYLCDLQGSASVLAKRLGSEAPDLDCPELAPLLVWFIKGDYSTPLQFNDGPFGPSAGKISAAMSYFSTLGKGDVELFSSLKELRTLAYRDGTPRQLLFADVICALAKKRYWNSAWYCLPRYSGLSKAAWEPVLQRATFHQDLWPAQHLLGEVGVYRGASAVVQMPTSAGKTHATEIILRSAFLSGRTSLAVVVAPFRALCHEIQARLLGAFAHDNINVDELMDVLQTDFIIEEIFGRRQVLVLTPEKLVYVLRHYPELAARIGLVIYDEGHQFDNGLRGVTYELLLTTLKRLLRAETQVLLISAVISNAAALNDWLNEGKDANVVRGQGLTPTYRTIGFASWRTPRGQIKFVAPSDPDEQEFFVPRVIEQVKLTTRKRENERLFPLKDDGGSIALYFGLKLAPQGGVAIFCGRKDSASGLCEDAVEIYKRGYSVPHPAAWSNQEEIGRLHHLHELNLGINAPITVSAKMGILTHHANVPHGLRNAIEYAMQKDLARFVICTSTLAQGVNLPLRYLIVTTTRQGGDALKVRDFHNLIGRAGRSGMHTEGSILFADPEIYDKKADKDEKWRWKNIKKFLEPGNSEPCASKLLSIFAPLSTDAKFNRLYIKMEPLAFVEAYVDDPNSIGEIADAILARNPRKGFSKRGLEDQIAEKMAIIKAVESFLMATEMTGALKDFAEELAQGTLAYHLASEDEKASITSLFVLLAENIERKVPDTQKRAAFGKTLYGVMDSLALEEWTAANAVAIAKASQDGLFDLLWPLLFSHVKNKTFRNCRSENHLKEVVRGWFHGQSFAVLHAILAEEDIRIGNHHPTVEHVVEICEVAVFYEGMLLINAVRELLGLTRPGDTATVEKLNLFQKRLKYGLDSMTAIVLFEMGFSDRVISAELAGLIGAIRSRAGAISRIRHVTAQAREMMGKYPAYFSSRLEAIV